MKLDGRIEIAAAGPSVWATITDPLSLAGCVPGVGEVTRVDERTFRGSIRASVGPIDGDFTFDASIERADYPDALEVALAGLDSVTKSRLTATVHATLTEDGRASVVAYRAEIRVQGRLAILGEMVLRATATMMIGQVVACLRSRLEGASA